MTSLKKQIENKVFEINRFVVLESEAIIDGKIPNEKEKTKYLKRYADQLLSLVSQRIRKSIPKEKGVSSLEHIDRDYKMYNQALAEVRAVLKDLLKR